MAVLKNARHEAFAQAVAEGMSGTQAYRKHVAEPGSKTDTCMCNASTLLADPKVKQRVSELRTSFREVLENKLGIRQETIARYLAGVLETPVGEVTEESEICQEYKRTRKIVGHGEDAEEWEVEQVKLPSKLDAAKELNKMAGFYAPEKIEHTGEVGITGLADILKALTHGD